MSRACKGTENCGWPHCECPESVYPWAARNHGIARDEWVRRFHERVAAKAVNEENQKLAPAAAAEIGAIELEVWPEAGDPHNGPDWMWTLPEDAADEQMGNWADDQEP